MKKGGDSSLKLKFGQPSGERRSVVWFEGGLGCCPVCQGSGKVRCFDCNGYGIHPWAVVDERLAGGQPCKLCKGARQISCPVCAPQSYKTSRASVLGISTTASQSSKVDDDFTTDKDDDIVLQPMVS
eukprot:jgi/Galph1/904/GphlegSOOS_G5633.1